MSHHQPVIDYNNTTLPVHTHTISQIRLLIAAIELANMFNTVTIDFQTITRLAEQVKNSLPDATK